MSLLSDADLGLGGKSGGLLSDEDLGIKAPAAKAEAREPPLKTSAPSGETLNGAVAGRAYKTKALASFAPITPAENIGHTAAAAGAQLGDMILSAVPDLAAKVLNTGTRLYAGATGESHKIVSDAGEQAEQLVPEWMKSPLQTLLTDKALGGRQEPELVNKSIDNFAQALDKGTKGILNEKDSKYLLGMLLDTAGAESVHAGAVKLALRAKELTQPQTVGEHALEVEASAKAAIAGKPKLSPAETKAYLDSVKETARKAFPDDKDYASHLSYLEEEKLNAPDEKGGADPKFLASVAGLTAGGVGLYAAWKHNKREDERRGMNPSDAPQTDLERQEQLLKQQEDYGQDRREYELEHQPLDWRGPSNGLLGGLGLGAAVFGAIKSKGGMWHPEAVERLSNAISPRPNAGTEFGEPPRIAAENTHAKRMVSGYLNKHAGTATDPLKDVEIPFATGTKRWEDVTDRAFKGEQVQGPKGQETQFTMPKGDGKTLEGSQAHFNQQALTSYLSHVGDYLREHVDPEKLGQYDLVRAVKETRKWDDELAKNMEKAQLDDTKGSPVYKDYGDGMRWVQLTKPGQFARESDAMGHSVRGYEPPKSQRQQYNIDNPKGEQPHPDWVPASGDSGHPSYGLGGWEAIKSGDAKVYSLRDAKGKSHVTVEVQGKFNPKELLDPSQMMRPHEHPELESITQIKGKQNRAPSAEYLPYVQDFVKGGKWGEVGDYANTGLYKRSELKPNVQEAASSMYPGEEHLTPEQLDRVIDRNSQGTFGAQRGSVDPRLLARMAAVGVGAAVGSQLDSNDHLAGAFLGGLAGAAMGHLATKGTVDAVRSAFKPDDRIRVNELSDAHEHAVAAAGRSIWQQQKAVEKLVPKAERREAITHAIEANDLSGLSESEKKAAGIVKQFFEASKKSGLDSGVLKNSLANYVTHLWGKDAKTQGILAGMLDPRAGGPSMSPESRFAMKRSIPTIAEGKRLGMTPMTEDISSIMGIYGNSIARSIENSKFLAALKNEKEPGGAGLIEKAGKAPSGYMPIDHPQMRGLLVHPDIAPSLKFIFDNRDPGMVMRGLEGLNTAVKRSAVSFSLFHAKALTDALIGAASNPLSVGKTLVTSALGTNKYLKMLREGGAGDLVDKALQGGLKFSMEKGKLADEDVGGSFYGMLKDLRGLADKTIPGSGLLVKGVEKVNHAVDTLMWERLHAGMKLSIFAEKYEALLENNAKAHLRDPARNPLRSEKEVSAAAASFTNDIFGGLNWRRVAEETKTRWGRDLALSALSPSGRRVMQLLMFAPDWTISTTRAALKAFGPGSGVRGLLEPKTVADLHRQYILRSAIYYVAVGDSINYAMSGHHIWDNKDPTTIDMGDGRTMQWSKHTMEPVHWLTKPGQQAVNKLGIIPREIASQVQGKQYLTTSGQAPPLQGFGPRVAHVAKAVEPIALQQGLGSTDSAGIAGFLGAPIYGRTYAQRDALKQSAAVRRRLERRYAQ